MKYRSLKLMAYNLENLFVPPFSPEYIERTSLPDHFRKPPEKMKRIAETLDRYTPDIIMCSEVGGVDSLENFNKIYLEDKYHPAIIEGNSDRGIDLGFLIRKDLPYKYEQYTHRERSLNFNYPHEEEQNNRDITKKKAPSFESHKLSRDIAELRVFSNENSETPIFILLQVHLKSQLDKDKIDPNGRLRRAAELKMLVDTYNILNKRYDKKVPIIVSGDFNGTAQKDNCDEEFKYLYSHSDLEDTLEVLNSPQDERITMLHFAQQGKATKLQLDYIFLPPLLFGLLDKKESGVCPYWDKNGRRISRPKQLYQRYQLPSDHYPVLVKIDGIFPES